MSDFKQILTAEFISVNGGLIVGILLSSIKDAIRLIPGILILLPGFFEMRGNLSGTLSARLSSALHLGSIKPFKKSRITISNLIATIILTIMMSFLLGALAYAINLLFGVSNLKIILVSIIAGLVSGALIIPITVISVFLLFKKGYDPDNIMGPYITTIGDITSTIGLITALVVL